MMQMELENKHNASGLNKQLQDALGKLKAYEALEAEIDEAVLSTAATREVTQSGGSVADGSSSLHAILSSGASLERRVSQSIHLARKLLESERERKAMVVQLNEARAAETAAKQQASDAMETAKLCNQPTGYLVHKLREESAYRTAAQQHSKSLQDEIDKLRTRLAEKEGDLAKLTQKMKALLQNRSELSDIRVLLEHMRSQSVLSQTLDRQQSSPLSRRLNVRLDERSVESSEDSDSHASDSADDGSSSDDDGSSTSSHRGRKPESHHRQSPRQSDSATTVVEHDAVRANVSQQTPVRQNPPSQTSTPHLNAGKLLGSTGLESTLSAQALGLSSEMIAKLVTPPRIRQMTPENSPVGSAQHPRVWCTREEK